jgi:hypothetical protein
MGMLLSALYEGKLISMIPMGEVVNKVRILLGGSSSDDSDDDEPEWIKRGDCCSNMDIVEEERDLLLGGRTKSRHCRNCGAKQGKAW